MDIFQLGDFTLNSGAKSSWKLECDALTDGEINALAKMVAQMIGPFQCVVGVPRGGLRIAEALTPLRSLSGPHLVVDDVLTTGGSIERHKDALLSGIDLTDAHKPPQVVGAVVFARGQLPIWVKALFSMPECFWLKPRHR